MSVIKSCFARQILDSRGNPTIEVEIILDHGEKVVASIPSGSSLGKYEAVEVRDNDPDHFGGMGVLKAVANFNNLIAPALIGADPTRQSEIDQKLIDLDGTENKSKLGANAILAASLGVCKAGASASQLFLFEHIARLFGLSATEKKLPGALFNLINGGKHGAGNLDFQEFHVIPAAHLSFSQTLEIGEEIYQAAKKVLIRHKAIHSVGDEGGYAPNLFTNLDALEILVEAIRESGHELRRDVNFGLDVAASNFYQGGKYLIRDRTLPMDNSELADYYRDLHNQYPLLLLEDPFHEDDWDGWQKVSEILPDTLIVGDDLLATNKNRVVKAIEAKACSAALIKPNQIGTFTETIEVIKQARQAGWKIIVSHRSGETQDDFIADFAVGVGADYVKFGAPARGERVAKYNRLLKIEQDLTRV